MAHQLKKDGIQLIIDYSDKPYEVLGNFNQLQQVILNLISNSRFALNERHPKSSIEKIIEISISINTSTEEKKVCNICIKDYGSGIPQGILNIAFTVNNMYTLERIIIIGHCIILKI